MKYYIIAGEASGDLHGSNLMKGLYAVDPDANIRFWGGGMMKGVWEAHQGAEEGGLVKDYRDTAVMGITDVLKNLGKISRNLAFCKEDLLDWKPDVLILIDYPGFNLKMARFAHEHGIRVFYYIAPKVWASRENRVRKIKRYVDKLFLIFPFEIPYFTRKEIPFEYRGNPLIDAVDGSPAIQESREEFFRRHGLQPQRYIAILAGSRKGEISRMMPVCMAVADHLCRQDAGLHFIVAGAPSRSAEDYSAWLDGRPRVKLVFGDTYGVLRHAECAVINSGTASLEAALIGTPQVVCWSASALTAFVGRHIFRVLDHIKYISLGNLIADRLVFKELIQEDFTQEKVEAELHRLMEKDYRDTMLQGYGQIRKSLGESGASRAIAEAMIEALKKGK